jgi:hypothetical protein
MSGPLYFTRTFVANEVEVFDRLCSDAFAATRLEESMPEHVFLSVQDALRGLGRFLLGAPLFALVMERIGELMDPEADGSLLHALAELHESGEVVLGDAVAAQVRLVGGQVRRPTVSA